MGRLKQIERCIKSGKQKKPEYRRLKELGLLDWSLEAAVKNFPAEFSPRTLAYAGARIRGNPRSMNSRSAVLIALALAGMVRRDRRRHYRGGGHMGNLL